MSFAAWVAASAQMPTYHWGRTPTAEEIRAWDISISPQGDELPPGSGTAKEGAAIYARQCAACHGPTGTEGGLRNTGKPPRLVGGKGTIADWHYATSIWDFTNRAMPIGNYGSLTANEVYALTAWMLYKNGLIQETDVMDAKSLPKVQMPNRKAAAAPSK